MGGNPAKTGNKIAQASLDESRRQFEEQKAKEKAQKETAMANAAGSRVSGNMAYANNVQVDNTLNTGGGFSLISTASGTPSVLNTLIGGDRNSTLGG